MKDIMEHQIAFQRIQDFHIACEEAVLMKDGLTWKVVMFDSFFQMENYNLTEEEQIDRITLESRYGFHVRDEEGNYTNILLFLKSLVFLFTNHGRYTLSAAYEPFTKAVIVYCLYIRPLIEKKEIDK
jgi:hypothetical protein